MQVKQYFYEIAEKDPQMENYTNKDIAQNPTSRAKICTLSTQNSHHDKLFEPDCLLDDEGRKLLII